MTVDRGERAGALGVKEEAFVFHHVSPVVDCGGTSIALVGHLGGALQSEGIVAKATRLISRISISVSSHNRAAMSDTSADPPTDEPHKTCSLVGPVALVVQALMAVLVVGSLLVKRWYEGRGGRKKRRWRVWIADVGKQLIGQAAVHGSNLVVSRGMTSENYDRSEMTSQLGHRGCRGTAGH